MGYEWVRARAKQDVHVLAICIWLYPCIPTVPLYLYPHNPWPKHHGYSHTHDKPYLWEHRFGEFNIHTIQHKTLTAVEGGDRVMRLSIVTKTILNAVLAVQCRQIWLGNIDVWDDTRTNFSSYHGIHIENGMHILLSAQCQPFSAKPQMMKLQSLPSSLLLSGTTGKRQDRLLWFTMDSIWNFYFSWLIHDIIMMS